MLRAILAAIRAGILSAFKGICWFGSHAWDATRYTADVVSAPVRYPFSMSSRVARGVGRGAYRAATSAPGRALGRGALAAGRYTGGLALNTGDALLRAPGGILRRLAGGGGGTPPLPQPQSPAPKAKRQRKIDDAAMPTASELAQYQREGEKLIASAAWKVARARANGESLLSTRVEKLMSQVPPGVRAWLDLLDEQELARIAGGGISRMAGHISGRRPIHGVRKVGAFSGERKERRAATDDEFNAALGLAPAF